LTGILLVSPEGRSIAFCRFDGFSAQGIYLQGLTEDLKPK